MSSPLSSIRRLGQWGPRRLAILATAVALTGLNTIAIPITGLGRWQRLLGRLVPKLRRASSAAERERLIEQTMAIMVAAHRRRLLPGSCLARSLALQTILAASDIRGDLRVGVRRRGDGVEAHAWIECDDRRLDLDAEENFAPFDQPIRPTPETGR